MDFWTDGRIADIEDKKQESIANPEKFLDDYSKVIREYQEFKESEEYLSSSYEEYYQNLLKANVVFLEKFSDFR